MSTRGLLVHSLQPSTAARWDGHIASLLQVISKLTSHDSAAPSCQSGLHSISQLLIWVLPGKLRQRAAGSGLRQVRHCDRIRGQSLQLCYSAVCVGIMIVGPVAIVQDFRDAGLKRCICLQLQTQQHELRLSITRVYVATLGRQYKSVESLQLQVTTSQAATL